MWKIPENGEPTGFLWQKENPFLREIEWPSHVSVSGTELRVEGHTLGSNTPQERKVDGTSAVAGFEANVIGTGCPGSPHAVSSATGVDVGTETSAVAEVTV